MPSVISTNLAKPKPPAQSQPELAPNDATLFRDAVGDVKLLPASGRIAPPPTPVRPQPRRRSRDPIASPDLLSDHLAHANQDDDEQSFLRPGVAPLTLRRLRREHWPIQDELDLHGLTRDTARTRLVTFLDQCRRTNAKCVRIIHGKGHGSKDHAPVLKQLVKSWLTQRPDVLAFTPARPEAGGSGALLVLLKSARPSTAHQS